MAVPSNDFFIGNDSPMRSRIFDAAGKPIYRITLSTVPAAATLALAALAPAGIGASRRRDTARPRV